MVSNYMRALNDSYLIDDDIALTISRILGRSGSFKMSSIYIIISIIFDS